MVTKKASQSCTLRGIPKTPCPISSCCIPTLFIQSFSETKSTHSHSFLRLHGLTSWNLLCLLCREPDCCHCGTGHAWNIDVDLFSPFTARLYYNGCHASQRQADVLLQWRQLLSATGDFSCICCCFVWWFQLYFFAAVLASLTALIPVTMHPTITCVLSQHGTWHQQKIPIAHL